MPKTESPCVNVCRLDPSGVCTGCFRTVAEIRAWRGMSDEERVAVNRRVRPLIAGGRKLRRLDDKIRKLEARLAKLRDRRRRAEEKAAQTARTLT